MKKHEIPAMHGRDGARPSRGGLRGFTLIEVLASMAVLLILTLALTRMFVSATDITKRGMTSIARNSVGETAMESILQDLDCMVVNERLACCKIADVVEDRFDTLYFMGTSGDQDDDMPYEYFNYYVKPSVATNSLGAEYKRFDLVKARVVMALGAKEGFYALDPSDREWWEPFSETTQDEEVLAENVVGFEIYCQKWDTGIDIPPNDKDIVLHNVNVGNKVVKHWHGEGYSTASSVKYKRKNGGQESITNMPPVSFDVKLKLTSPEAAVEGGMLLMADDADTQKRGWELLNREASTLFGRATPMMGASQFRLQQRSVKNPVSHYYSEK